MNTAAALLAQQPAAFWLAVMGVSTAGAIAIGRRAAVGAALAVGLGALVAVVAPTALLAQAAAAFAGAAGALAVAFAKRAPHAPAAQPPAPPPEGGLVGAGEAGLLGRTARTCANFVAGQGEVEVDGRTRAARTLAADEFLGADVLVRIVRVGEAALVVRPVAPSP